MVDACRLCRPRAARRRRRVGRSGRLRRLALRRGGPAHAPSHRGGVGEGRTRRPRGCPLPRGRRASGYRARRAPAARDRGQAEPAGPPRAVWRLPRVVPGLGRRRLLRGLARARSRGTAIGHPTRLARRRLAAPGPLEPGGPPLVPAARASLLGLRLPRGLALGASRPRPSPPGTRPRRRHRYTGGRKRGCVRRRPRPIPFARPDHPPVPARRPRGSRHCPPARMGPRA